MFRAANTRLSDLLCCAEDLLSRAAQRLPSSRLSDANVGSIELLPLRLLHKFGLIDAITATWTNCQTFCRRPLEIHVGRLITLVQPELMTA